MLNVDIINSKTERIDPKTGKPMLDLVAASWNPRSILYQLETIAIVNDETQMRGDLVALSYMGNSTNIGTLLKINNISNPLSLKTGEILLVPGRQMVTDLFNSAPKADIQKSKAKSFRKELQEKISKVSEERLEYLNAKNISGVAQTPLPPNILKDGEKQISVEEGKLIFGPSIGQCKSKAPTNISVTDIKAKLAQKNIFKK